MAFFETVGLFLWDSLKLWLFTIFVAPVKNFSMLWILIPVYLTWFFAEFFQEKHGTSMGNAITNAVVVFWAGFDWSRNTVTKITDGVMQWGLLAFSRIALSVILIGFGIVIVVLGLKGNKLIKFIGRIREVTYIVIMFTPVFYEVTPLTWQHVFAALLFFPIYYFAIELLDHYMPNPKAVVEDLKDAGKGGASFSGSMGEDSFKEPSMGDSGMGDIGAGNMGDMKI